MTSPSSAFAWEIWQRHGKRLALIILAVLGFALIYPRVCAALGLDLHSASALDYLATTFSQGIKQTKPLLGALQVVAMLFLLLGPIACMLLSLLYVIWVFTFAESDPVKGFAFPGRLFRLPVSTTFLAGWLLAAGAASVTLIYLAWTRLVPMPSIEVFNSYSNLPVWLTLLLVCQAVVWVLDGFPVVRILTLGACIFFFGFLGGPSIQDHSWLQQHRTLILLAFSSSACVAAFAGLTHIRQGRWQCWPWEHRRHSENKKAARLAASSRVIPAFSSPARAQFWFEWRNNARKLLLYVCALSGAGLLIMAVVAAVLGEPLSEGDSSGLIIYLLAVPPLIFLTHGLVPERHVPIFLAVRPLSIGQMMAAKLKALGISAVLCWALTFALFALLLLFVDVPSTLAQVPPELWALPWHILAIMPLALIFLTWRFAIASQYLTGGGNWLSKLPILNTYGVMALFGLCCYLIRKPVMANWLFHHLPWFLLPLLALKFYLAQKAFRVSLQRGLLDISFVRRYLAIWIGLALVFSVPLGVSFCHEAWCLSLCLAIPLVLPMARIGFTPIALSTARHG